MSHTAHKTDEEIKEHFESEDVLDAKCQQLAAMIKKSKHCIFFTGAGISTAAGISDFRGPSGVWTVSKYGTKYGTPSASKVSTLKAVPTKSHMSIVQLIKTGQAKYLVSQNTDGLHRRSGLDPSTLSELHGNSNIELCTKCGKEYLRDFRVRTSTKTLEHLTGRLCDNPACKGPLKDTIINFTESLPQVPLAKAYEHAEKADLCISLGSSLTVSPANDIPETVGQNGTLVIVNLQKTPLDNLATLRIFGKCDDVMERTMKYLQTDIPSFVLRRRVKICKKNNILSLYGIDVDNTPVTMFPMVKIDKCELKKEPYTIDLSKLPTKDTNTVRIELHFNGNYNEPPLAFQHDLSSAETKYLLEFDLNKWKVSIYK